MKSETSDNGSFRWPTALLMEVQAAAEKEHRSTEEIVHDAVRLYLQRRRHTLVIPESPAEKARAFEAWAHGPFPYTATFGRSYTPGNLIRNA